MTINKENLKISAIIFIGLSLLVVAEVYLVSRTEKGIDADYLTRFNSAFSLVLVVLSVLIFMMCVTWH